VKERRFDTGGTSINDAEGAGNGPSLVLLHGGSSRWQWWESVIDPIAERTHAFAPDLRGHGLSTWTPGQYRLFDYAEDIASFLEGVVHEPAIVLGHSLGGEIAMIVAAMHPASVTAVINEDGPLSVTGARRAVPSSRPMLEAMRENAGSTLPEAELMRRVADVPVGFDTGLVMRFGDAVGGDQNLLRWWAETARRNDPAMIDAVIEFERMHAGHDDTILARIECPVVILQADPEQGSALTDADIARAMTLLRDGRRVRADGLGHSMHIEDPDWFVRTVLGLIDELSRVPGP
jgi:pimeloyl-ACP methyl ester carboxylesterase